MEKIQSDREKSSLETKHTGEWNVSKRGLLIALNNAQRLWKTNIK